MGDRIEFVNRSRRRKIFMGAVLPAMVGVGAILVNYVSVGALVALSAVVGGIVWFGLR